MKDKDWSITKRLLNCLDSKLSEVAWAAAIPHWFNDEVLAALCPNIQSEIKPLYEELQTIPFTEDFLYRGHNIHDRARNSMLTYLCKEKTNQFLKLSTDAARYFERQAQNNNSRDVIEWLYHLVIADFQKAFNELKSIQQRWTKQGRTSELAFLNKRLLEQVESYRIKNGNQTELVHLIYQEPITELEWNINIININDEDEKDYQTILAHCNSKLIQKETFNILKKYFLVEAINLDKYSFDENRRIGTILQQKITSDNKPQGIIISGLESVGQKKINELMKAIYYDEKYFQQNCPVIWWSNDDVRKEIIKSPLADSAIQVEFDN